MSQTSIAQPGVKRRRELDAMRLLVVFGLFLFHSALIFDPTDDYYIKNPQTTSLVTYAAALCVVWAMPLLFLVAGIGSWFSLRRRSAGGFAKARLLRLGVPLVAGTLLLMPIPQWYRFRAADPSYRGSYLSFWADFLHVRLQASEFPFILDGAGRRQSFETGQLWFLVLLLTFSLLFLPLLAWLRGPSGSGALERLGRLAARPWGILVVPSLPLVVVGASLDLEEGIAAWNRWSYALFFLYGFAVAAQPAVLAAMRRLRRPAALIGAALWIASIALYTIAERGDIDPFTRYDGLSMIFRATFGATGWLWLVAILGFAQRSMGEARTVEPGVESGWARFERWGNDAALPLYVIHQPAIVAIAFTVVQWAVPSVVKYAVIVMASFALCAAAYEWLIRPFRPMRFLFGMTPVTTDPGPVRSPAAGRGEANA
jgi:glucan biosynthesis protein C